MHGHKANRKRAPRGPINSRDQQRREVAIVYKTWTVVVAMAVARCAPMITNFVPQNTDQHISHWKLELLMFRAMDMYFYLFCISDHVSDFDSYFTYL